jgi:hypothetical protein
MRHHCCEMLAWSFLRLERRVTYYDGGAPATRAARVNVPATALKEWTRIIVSMRSICIYRERNQTNGS